MVIKPAVTDKGDRNIIERKLCSWDTLIYYESVQGIHKFADIINLHVVYISCKNK